MWVLYVFSALLLVLISVIITRTILFRPPVKPKPTVSNVELDKDSIISTLSEMIKCKTVSNYDKSLEDENEFNRFRELLPDLFPKVSELCRFESIGDRGILIKLSGKNSSKASVFMSHYDVVPADEKNWRYDPFSAVVAEEALWGRGTLDTKSTLNAVMQALEHLLKNGFVPDNDIYLAFGGDEEVTGHGSSDMVEHFQKNNINVNFVLDEGGAIVSNVFPGVNSKAALIGTGEKGILNLKLTAKSNGGHASSPPKNTPVQRLAKACIKISENPFNYRVSKPVNDLFKTVAPYSTFLYRIIFANLWLFSPLVALITSKRGGELNALVRTTCAFTQASGSDGANVLPTEASLVLNIRINQGEDYESVIEYIRKKINDPDIIIEPIYKTNPSKVSTTECDEYSLLKDAISLTWNDVVVSPYLMVACSDSRHWGKICDNVYRFSPMEMVDEIRGTVHGNNERIPLEVLYKTVEFYINLIKKC